MFSFIYSALRQWRLRYTRHNRTLRLSVRRWARRNHLEDQGLTVEQVWTRYGRARLDRLQRAGQMHVGAGSGRVAPHIYARPN